MWTNDDSWWSMSHRWWILCVWNSEVHKKRNITCRLILKRPYRQIVRKRHRTVFLVHFHEFWFYCNKWLKKKNNVKVEIRWKGWLMSTLYICDETIKINESWKYRSSSRNVNGSCVLSLWLRMIQTMTNKGFILDPCQVWHCLICYEN